MNRINNTSIRVRLMFSISAPFLAGTNPRFELSCGCSVSKELSFNPVGLFYYNLLCGVYYSMSNDDISTTLSL